MTEWLNPGLDRGTIASVFRTNRHIRIANVLKPEKANAVLGGLSQIGGWSLLCGTAHGTASIDPAELDRWTPERQAEFQAALAADARNGVGFAYLGYSMDQRWREGAPNTPLGDFYRALTSDEILGFIASISNRDDLGAVSAQATRFGPSHYLTRHRDDPEQEQRRLAFVWGFTPQWHPDWGGLLQFYTDQGAPTLSFAPGFNTLDIFEIDHVHAVTFITPFAGGVRQVVSGWYLAAPSAA